MLGLNKRITMKNLIDKIKRQRARMLCLLILALASCDQGFEKINKDPNAYSDPIIEDMFAFAVVRGSLSGTDGDSVDLRYCSSLMQYFASLWTERWFGDKYNHDTMNFWGRLFDQGYTTYLKEIEQIISLVKDNPEQSNFYALARIWRVFGYHRITDIHGDIPYFQAGKGYLEGIYKVEYDPQSVIYADMLKELEEAALLLDPAKPSFGTSDFIYGGDVVKWKRFAYSMMLRLGMRLTKVDPAMAETWVKKAIAGGVMQGNEDIAFLEHTSEDNRLNHNSTNAFIWLHEMNPSSEGVMVSKLSQTFINELKAHSDPRLPIFSTLWQGNADPSLIDQTTDPAIQKGLPNGYDETTIKTIIPNWDNQLLKEYSEINRWTIGSVEAPTIFQSYSEVELLLAEAAIRGWYASDPVAHYENGIIAHMEMIGMNPGNSDIPQSAISDYITNHPFPSAGSFEDKMKRIHYEMRMTHFMNFIEAYANWRRTGYPELIPTNWPGNLTNGTIPRRLPYPTSEAVNNTAAYNAALQRQGPDLLTTRVWWDKE